MAHFVLKNGKRLLVIRPRDPQLALKLAADALAQQYTQEQFDAMLAQQMYSVAGFPGRDAGKDPIVVDHAQRKIGVCAAGDSFVGMEDAVLDQLKPGDPFIATTSAGQA